MIGWGLAEDLVKYIAQGINNFRKVQLQSTFFLYKALCFVFLNIKHWVFAEFQGYLICHAFIVS